MKTPNHTRTLIPALALVGGSLLAYAGGAHAAVPADEGPQALARALLSPPVRRGAVDPDSAVRVAERVAGTDAMQLAQRFLTGATDARTHGAPGRQRLAAGRHYGDAHEFARRTILGQRV